MNCNYRGYVCFSNSKSRMLISLALYLEIIWNATWIGGIHHLGGLKLSGVEKPIFRNLSPLFATFSHFSYFSPLFPHFSPLFATFSNCSPISTTFPYFSSLFHTFPNFSLLFPIFHHFSPLLTTFSHFFPLFATFSHFPHF